MNDMEQNAGFIPNEGVEEETKPSQILRSALDKLTNEELAVLSGFLMSRHSEYINRIDNESDGTIGVVGKVTNPNSHLEWIGIPKVLKEIGKGIV